VSRTLPFRHPTEVLDTLPATHRRVGIVPGGDDSLRYTLPVPRGWGRVSGLASSPAPGRPELLGVFSPQPDLSGPRIMVSVARLRWDVDPLRWVRHGWEAAGWSVAVARPLEERWRPRFEIGVLRSVDGEVEVRRSTGFVDNGRLIRVDVAAPLSWWPKLHDLLWPCGVCMELAQPTKRAQIEATQRYGGPLVTFELPQSWHASKAKPLGPEATRWVAAPGEEVGRSVALRIDVTAWPSGGAEAIEIRQRRVRRELWARGISMSRQVQRLHAGVGAEAKGLVGLFYAEAHDRDENFEIRLAHCDTDGLSVDYTMLVASPETHIVDRLRAARALEIALMTTQTRPEDKTHAA